MVSAMNGKGDGDGSEKMKSNQGECEKQLNSWVYIQSQYSWASRRRWGFRLSSTLFQCGDRVHRLPPYGVWTINEGT